MKRAELFSAVAHEMKGLGFKRRKSNYEYVLDLGPGFEGWCSFADATKGEKTALWVATFVGVRSAEIENRILAWCGDVVPGWDGRFYVPTVSMNVGYLAPESQWREHRIDLAAHSVEDAIRPNLSDVTDIALDFLREHASYAGLAAAMKLDRGQLTERTMERLPIALALQGDMEGAHRELAPMRRQVDEAAYLAPRYLRYLQGFETEFPLERLREE
ncbi:hypothetical protein [Streptomyces aurantiogriseus]|uniref:Uncharacterized protein n=1 Tax=Streptomyces aurantiogriseus TaxID=66870 RepID=A0A918FBT3_9ACTN|nr:hypothetical protein [Streptomyces aurantiogriseus]GGR19773.1 hypothetical protein GCM10010251_39950 [Streptomyces aurantiogriseus]